MLECSQSSLHETACPPNKKWNWIEEEKCLLHLIDSGSFELKPLDFLLITFVYIDNEQIVGTLDVLHNLSIGEKRTVLEWSPLKQMIDSHSKWKDDRYVFNEAAIYHICASFDELETFSPVSTFAQIEKGKDIKLPATVPALHDLSQLFVFFKRIPPERAAAKLKSILKTGERIGKTKKLRISFADTIGDSSICRKQKDECATVQESKEEHYISLSKKGKRTSKRRLPTA